MDTVPGSEPGPSPEPSTPSSVPVIPAAIAVAPSYRDRGTGLVIFGVVQILLGLFAALMVPFIALGAFMSRLAPGGAMRPGQVVSGVATYAVIAVALLVLGIGSIQMKRWAHALTVVTSWYWLIMGVLVTILMTAVLPVTMRTIFAQAQQNAPTPAPQMSTGIMAIILTVIIVFAAFFLVMLPIAFVVFYSRKDVAETVHHRDPVERWTDRSPLPVLGGSVAFFVGSGYMLMVGLTTPLFPFFGRYLTGVPAAACFVVLAALDFYLAVALFRLQAVGWWIAIATLPIRLVSMVLTYGRANLMEAYSKVGISEEQLRMLNASPMFRGHIFLWWSLLSLLVFFGYLVWLKRYFNTPRPVLANAGAAPQL